MSEKEEIHEGNHQEYRNSIKISVSHADNREVTPKEGQ